MELMQVVSSSGYVEGVGRRLSDFRVAIENDSAKIGSSKKGLLTMIMTMSIIFTARSTSFGHIVYRYPQQTSTRASSAC